MPTIVPIYAAIFAIMFIALSVRSLIRAAWCRSGRAQAAT